MSRITIEAGRSTMVALICKYIGDVNEAPGFKDKLEQLVEISRYRLFHGTLGDKCYFQVSQGKGPMEWEELGTVLDF